MNPDDFTVRASGQVRYVPTGYYTFIPDRLPPSIEWSLALVQALAAAQQALGELAGLGGAISNPYLLVTPFVRREAVLSSRIEGTRASLTDLLAYEAVQLSFWSEENPTDVREVHNYVVALEYGLERLLTFPMSLRLMRELHARLMADTRGQERTPGEFRRSQNWIGHAGADLRNATFVPPPIADMQESLGYLEKFIHESDELPALIRIGLIHYQFEAIHPFLDGNGRVGRLLITLLLCAWELLPQSLLYLSAFFEQHRQEYYDRLLAVSRKGEWEQWLIFFLAAVATQARDAINRINRLMALQNEIRSHFRAQARTSAGLMKTVDFLFSQPVTTINQVADRLGISYHSAARNMALLEKLGLVREMTGKARNRVFIADRVLRAIESPLEEDDHAIRPF